MASSSSVRRLSCIAGHVGVSSQSVVKCSDNSAIPQTAFTRGSAMPALTPGKLRLYSMRFCPWAQRTRLVLLHKNISHETVNINLAKKPNWLFERNPLGLVPVLELDDKIIFESSATCNWLDETYPQNRLTPTDAYRRAWDRILEDNFGKVANSLYSIIGHADKETTLKNLHKAYKLYEKVLVERGGPFFGDDKPAMIDFLMWPHMERIPAVFRQTEPRAMVDEQTYPRLTAWYHVMYQRPEVKATLFDDDSHQKFLMSLRTKTFDMYDYGL